MIYHFRIFSFPAVETHTCLCFGFPSRLSCYSLHLSWSPRSFPKHFVIRVELSHTSYPDALRYIQSDMALTALYILRSASIVQPQRLSQRSCIISNFIPYPTLTAKPRQSNIVSADGYIARLLTDDHRRTGRARPSDRSNPISLVPLDVVRCQPR
jgi:hypothetical protein